MNIDDLPRRQSQLKDDVRAETALFEAGEISQKSYTSLVNEAYRENQQLETTLKNLEWGRGMVAAQEAAFTDGLQTKAMGVGPNRLPSPMDLTETQLKALWMAAKARTPFNVEIGQKGGLEQAWASQITTKSPALESGIGGGFSGQLPPVQTQFWSGSDTKARGSQRGCRVRRCQGPRRRF